MTTTEQREASQHEGRDSRGRRHHPSSRSRRDDPSPRRRRDDRRHESGRDHHKSRDEESARVTGRDEKRNKDVAGGDEPLNDEEKSLSHVKDNPPVRRERSPRGTKRFSESRESGRPRSFVQHDERGSAGQGGRHYDRQTSDYGRKRGEKDRFVDRDEHREKANGNNLQVKVEQDQQQKDGDSTWKHDGFFQLEEEAPLAKRRPPFQEMTMSLEQETAPSVTELDARSGKHYQPGSTAAMMREERTHYHSRGFGNRRPFVRPDGFRRGFLDHGGDGQRPGYDSRERFSGRGRMDRDRFHNPNGWKSNEYQATSDQGEKWKHDLYDQTNRSPTPKTEEEQIAKVEALLAL